LYEPWPDGHVTENDPVVVASVRVEMLREPNATLVALAEQVPTSARAGAEISNKHEIRSHT